MNSNDIARAIIEFAIDHYEDGGFIDQPLRWALDASLETIYEMAADEASDMWSAGPVMESKVPLWTAMGVCTSVRVDAMQTTGVPAYAVLRKAADNIRKELVQNAADQVSPS